MGRFYLQGQTWGGPEQRLPWELWHAGTNVLVPPWHWGCAVATTPQGSANPGAGILLQGRAWSCSGAFWHFNIHGENSREEVMAKAAGFDCSFLQHISNPANEAQGGYFQFNPSLPAVVWFLMFISSSVTICVSWIVNISLLPYSKSSILDRK